MNIYEFNCHLSYQFRYRFSCFLELEANLLEQNMNELEFELSRIQMKQLNGLVEKG